MSTLSKTRGIIRPSRPASGLSCPTAFEILSNDRRRLTLDCLADVGEAVDLRTLSTRLAARENDVESAAVTGKQRKRTYTALRQTHLPKMDDAGVVEFHAARGVVEPTPLIWELQRYVDRVRRPDVVGREYYISIVAFVGLALGARAAGLLGYDWPTSEHLLALGLALILVGSLADVGYDLWHRRTRGRCPK
ncbi:MAG: hypothetical protein ABEJ76_03110 [Halanaeroarchaeum sp.]